MSSEKLFIATDRSVVQVAKKIIEIRGSLGALKLQKLVYYSNVWSIVLLKKILYQERIEAWRYGPVIPALYAFHKGKFVVELADLQVSEKEELVFLEDEIEIIARVCRYYGAMSGTELSNLTHKEKPWEQATKSGDPFLLLEDQFLPGYSQKISSRSIFEFYQKHKVPWL